MSRTGTYWSDHNGRLNCAHGVILHGTRCVQCERGDLPRDFDTTQRFPTGGFVPKGGPRMHSVDGKFVFTADDIKTDYEFRQAINGDEERLEAMQARMSEATRKIAEEIAERARRGEGWGGPYDTGKRWEHSRGDPRPRHQHCRSTVNAVWGDGTPLTDDEADLINGRYRGGEIITDPTDTRGVNARRVGPRA